MKTANPPVYTFKSHLRLYWILWLSYLGVCFILWSTPRYFAQPIRSNLPVIYMLGVWFPVMFLNLYEGKRLMTYLRLHHFDKWTELTTVLGFGPGNVNGFRSIPWLFSSDTLDDPMLGVIKMDYRRFIYLVLTVFFTFPLFCIVFST
jgi:hypothetical protein